jgi:NTE family protein
VGGRTYVDGAVRSTVNVDLAAGSGLVVVLAPMPPIGGIARELDRLPAGTRSHVVESDAQALASFGSNPLDPGTGPGAAREGYRQGQQSAPAVAALLAGR